MIPTTLVVDLSNIVWTIRHSALKKNNQHRGFEFQIVLTGTLDIIYNLYNQFKADHILIAADARHYWRKNIYPAYKGKRNTDQDEYKDLVNDVISTVANFFNGRTNIPALSAPLAEADDIIYALTVLSRNKIVIASTDKDFIQLISSTVKLYSPTLQKFRETSDAGYDLFEKCIRGDVGDNILSAFPRVRATRLKKAWEDPVEMVEIMESIREIDSKRVGDVYEFNKKLIDLSAIPENIFDDIKDRMYEVENQTNYSQIEVLKFLGENDLKMIYDDIQKYTRMFKTKFFV